MRKKLSLLITISLLSICALFTANCSNNGGEVVDDGDVNVGFNVNDPKIRDLLGSDDGYAFAIFYGSDIDGSLETCG